MKKIISIMITLFFGFNLFACTNELEIMHIKIPRDNHNMISYDKHLYYFNDESVSFYSECDGEVVLVDLENENINTTYITNGVEAKFNIKKGHPYIVGILTINDQNEDIVFDLKYEKDSIDKIEKIDHVIEYQKTSILELRDDVDYSSLIRYKGLLYAKSKDSYEMAFNEKPISSSTINSLINAEFIPMKDVSSNNEIYLNSKILEFDKNSLNNIYVETENSIDTFNLIETKDTIYDGIIEQNYPPYKRYFLSANEKDRIVTFIKEFDFNEYEEVLDIPEGGSITITIGIDDHKYTIANLDNYLIVDGKWYIVNDLNIKDIFDKYTYHKESK